MKTHKELFGRDIALLEYEKELMLHNCKRKASICTCLQVDLAQRTPT
jgi:hypothetical protein